MMEDICLMAGLVSWNTVSPLDSLSGVSGVMMTGIKVVAESEHCGDCDVSRLGVSETGAGVKED